MTHDEKICLELGIELLRMVHDLRKATQGETGYARRKLAFPGGEVHLLVANDKMLADRFEFVASENFDVHLVTPPSQVN
jgi:hypothetical protein